MNISKKLLPLFILAVSCILYFSFSAKKEPSQQWIRINQLGYTPGGIKVAVWCSKDNSTIKNFELIDSATGKSVFTQPAGNPFGAYGPFDNTYRLSFTSYKTPGVYYLKA